MRRNKTIHTSIKVGNFEAILLQETDNIRIVPVSTTTWSFNKNGNTVGNSGTSNLLESLPKFSKFSPVSFDLMDSRAPPVHIHVGPRRPPSTRTREPKRRFSAGQSFAAFVQSVARTPVIIFANRNDLTSFRPRSLLRQQRVRVGTSLN